MSKLTNSKFFRFPILKYKKHLNVKLSRFIIPHNYFSADMPIETPMHQIDICITYWAVIGLLDTSSTIIEDILLMLEIKNVPRCSIK